LENIKIKLEFRADIEIIKQVLRERGIEVNISNIKKIANVYKDMQYTIKSKDFFDEFPRDKETLAMYGFKLSKKKEDKK